MTLQRYYIQYQIDRLPKGCGFNFSTIANVYTTEARWKQDIQPFRFVRYHHTLRSTHHMQERPMKERVIFISHSDPAPIYIGLFRRLYQGSHAVENCLVQTQWLYTYNNNSLDLPVWVGEKYNMKKKCPPYLNTFIMVTYICQVHCALCHIYTSFLILKTEEIFSTIHLLSISI